MSIKISPQHLPILSFLESKLMRPQNTVRNIQNFKFHSYIVVGREFVVYEFQAYYQGFMWTLKCRYSCLANLHKKLIKDREAGLKFPPKQLLGNFKKEFINKRGNGLENYLNKISNSITSQNINFQVFITEQKQGGTVVNMLREEDFNLDD